MNILIIDDNSLFIDGLAYVLNKLAGQVTITASNRVKDAIRKLEQQTNYDLILLDLNIPDGNGLDFIQHFSAAELCIPVIILSSEQKPHLILQALDWGAMGFIPKSYSSQQMLCALQAVLDGLVYIPTEIKHQLDRLAATNHH